MKTITYIMIVAAVALPVATASATATYGFYGFNNNYPDNTTVGQEQFFVDVSDAGGGNVLFHFRNDGPIESAISNIFFDNSGQTLGGLKGMFSPDGVNFQSGSNPANLPGHNDLDPSFSADFAFQTVKNTHDAIGPGQYLELLFGTTAGYASVIDGLDAGGLRLGLQARGFLYGGEEDSAQFITRIPPIVPAPGAILLAGLGTAAVGVLRRRQVL